jgi:uncharacterized protein (TIGR02594 family)
MQWLIDLIKVIFAAIFGGKATTVPKPEKSADEPVSGEPKWMKIARAELGVKEVAGPAHNPAVLGYFRDAGFPEIDDDETAWCAGFANAMIERAGYNGSKSLAARSFLTWGKEVTKPYPGCLVVFWRVSPRSWQGHIAFYVGETKTHVKVLGGNQANAVNITEYPKSQVLGYRKPGTPANSRIMKASTAQMALLGVDGGIILESQGQINIIGDLIGQIGVALPTLLVFSILAKIVLQCVIIYARQDDAKKKGV